METTGNHIHFFISYAIAFLVLGMIARWYVWPVLKGRDLKLSPLLLYACSRVNGLMFLIAVPVAYGDLTLLYSHLSHLRSFGLRALSLSASPKQVGEDHDMDNQTLA